MPGAVGMRGAIRTPLLARNGVTYSETASSRAFAFPQGRSPPAAPYHARPRVQFSRDCTARPDVESRRAVSGRARVRKPRSAPASGARGPILASLRCTRGDPCHLLARNGVHAPGKPSSAQVPHAFAQVARPAIVGHGCTRGDPRHLLARNGVRAPAAMPLVTDPTYEWLSSARSRRRIPTSPRVAFPNRRGGRAKRDD